MLSLQSFLRKKRIVGPWWEKSKPKETKGYSAASFNRLLTVARMLQAGVSDAPRSVAPLTAPECVSGHEHGGDGRKGEGVSNML